MKCGEGPYSYQQCVCAMAGFATVLNIRFHYIHLSQATSRNWSGLTFRFAPFSSPPIPATSQTRTLCTRRQNGLRGQERFQFITSVLPDRLKEKIHLARARWSSLVDKSCRATSLQVVDIPQVFDSPPEQVCNA